MEVLKIVNRQGASLLEKDLSDARGTLILVERTGTVALVEAAAAGENVIGALIRTEDGWTLASADAARPVVAGPKAGGDLPLLPGTACAIGDFIFRLETDVARSGKMLLWRKAKSAVAADPVLAGKNVVAVDQLTNVLSVNPAVAGETLFEFYLTKDGIDVLTPDGARLSVPAKERVACGDFEGMLLEADEARRALSSRLPFAAPTRWLRLRLVAGLLLALGGFVFAKFIDSRTDELRACLAGLPGASRTAPTMVGDDSSWEGDAYLYELSVFRDMELVLGPRPSPVTADLIQRAEAFKDNVRVRKLARFLQQVVEIQQTVIANRWDELEALLAKVDRETFTLTAADRFLADAQAISRFSSRVLPDLAYRISARDFHDEDKAFETFEADLRGLDENLFIAAPEVVAARARETQRFGLLHEYIDARDAVLGRRDGTKDLSSAAIIRLTETYSRLEEDFSEAAYEKLLKRSREELAAYVKTAAGEIVGTSTPDRALSPEFVRLTPLCDLGECVGLSADDVRRWRTFARETDRRFEQRYRDLYQRYRLSAGSNPEEAGRILDEMLSLGVPGRYRTWALAEKEKRK